MKKLTILFAIVFMALCLNAQTPVKYFHINKDGVNVRKAPNTQAAKLTQEWTDDCYECGYIFNWPSTPKKKNYVREPYHPHTAEVLVAVDEQDGWTAFNRDIGYDYTPTKVWVSSQFVEELTPVKITPEEYIERANLYYYDIENMLRTTGKYAGLIFGIVDELNGLYALEMYFDGAIASTEPIDLSPQRNNSVKGIKLEKGDYGMYTLYFDDAHAMDDSDYSYDFSKFTDADIDYLIETLSKIGSFKWIFFKNPMPDNYHNGFNYLSTKVE